MHTVYMLQHVTYYACMYVCTYVCMHVCVYMYFVPYAIYYEGHIPIKQSHAAMLNVFATYVGCATFPRNNAQRCCAEKMLLSTSRHDVAIWHVTRSVVRSHRKVLSQTSPVARSRRNERRSRVVAAFVARSSLQGLLSGAG